MFGSMILFLNTYATLLTQTTHSPHPLPPQKHNTDKKKNPLPVVEKKKPWNWLIYASINDQ